MILITVLTVRYLEPQKQIELLATLTSNLLGTVIGAGLAFWFALRQFSIRSSSESQKNRIDTTFSLHQEITTELFEARVKADELLTMHKTKSLDILQNHLSETETRYVWQIIFFYRRLELAIDYERIELSLIPELFGQKFIWWYHVWLTSVVPSEWESSNQLKKLQIWVEKNSKESMYKQWKDDATQARSERLSSTCE
ncbi:MAG: hypothetical protein AAGE84_06240 [Cyanobacteria bacterium P01_G01_bin.39]